MLTDKKYAAGIGQSGGRWQFQDGANLSRELPHTTEHVDAVFLDVVQQVNRHSQPGQPNTVMPSRRTRFALQQTSAEQQE